MKKALVLCNCGHTQDEVLDFKGIAAGDLGGAVVLEYDSLCKKSTVDKMASDLKAQGVEGVVIGACSPKLIDVTLQKKLGGLVYVVVPLREHVALPNADEGKDAAIKASSLLKVGLETIDLQKKLEAKDIAVAGKVLVVGGGISGITCALSLSKADVDVTLVENTGRLGGSLNDRKDLFPFDLDAGELVQARVKELEGRDNVHVLLESSVRDINGYP
ncbi:MAG: FAD-dependent oxidoreductase, partial [Promethearchaeota archaeon]